MNAYASQTLGSYADDVFDVDMDFSETAPQPQASPLSFSTPPQPQTPPSAGAPQGGHQRVEAVTGYNPAGELAPRLRPV